MKISNQYNDRVAEIASGRQLEYYKALCEYGSVHGACNKAGFNRSSMMSSLNLLEKKLVASGIMAPCDASGVAGAGRAIGKVTTHIKGGEVQQEWIRTDTALKDTQAKIEEFLNILRDQVPVRDYQIEEPDVHLADFMSVYPMGDPHLGMYAWAEESGENFDCDTCEQQIVQAIDRLVDTQPASCIGRIHNLGDFFHSDTEDAVTRRSGNHLDVDGRWGRVLRIGVRMMTHCIDRCLEKHQKVEVVNVCGNHDDQTSYCLSIILAEHYRNEPRVFIDTTYSKFHYKEFGKVLIGCNHGMIKPQALLEVMVSDQAEAWGRTKFRYWHVGHVHHMTVKEVGGVVVESFRSLKAKDAHEAEKGYRAGRDMHALLFHKEWGLVERHVVCAAMLAVDVK